jgi:hypothetical protein
VADFEGSIMTIAPYKMKVIRTPRPDTPPNPLPQYSEPDEGLTGMWGGVALGSAEEERLLRGLSKLGKNFTPQWEVPTPYSLRGQSKQIDIIVWDSRLPVEVDGPFHRLATSQAQDAEKDALLNSILMPKGFQPIKRIDYWLLADQALADRVAEEL